MPKAGIQFSKKDQWNTPKEVINFFGPFDYDPATTDEQAKYLGIPHYNTIDTDGLRADWVGYKRIWINPPFTRKFEFLEKATRTIPLSYTKIFFLLPAETITTKKFHEIMEGVSYKMWIPNGRIKFDDGSGKISSPAFGSIVLELGGILGKGIEHWRLNG